MRTATPCSRHSMASFWARLRFPSIVNTRIMSPPCVVLYESKCCSIRVEPVGWIQLTCQQNRPGKLPPTRALGPDLTWRRRSEEHTSELQSHHDLVCRLLLEKKKKKPNKKHTEKTKIKQ